jgi:hypothetical protein
VRVVNNLNQRMSTTEDRFVFETEWFDQQASLVRKYLLTYYPKDCTIDMVSAPPRANIRSTTSRTNACF